MTLDISKYPTLALANTPEELRLLPKETLPTLCDELRTYLLNSVSQSSGHLASGLGTVELTGALHYVYNTPIDQYGAIIQEFGFEKSIKTQYLKVVAKNRGICPDWHLGAGNPTWIFADEIIVE